MNFHGSKLIALTLYKDSGGRKIVAAATNNSVEGKQALSKIIGDTLGVSYGEKSGPILGSIMKTIGFDILKPFLIKPEYVGDFIGKSVTPISDYDMSKLSDADKFTFDKFVQLRDYFYIREIVGADHMKILIGTTGVKIY